MAMIVCPNCGEQVSDRAKKCVHCGEILIPEEKKYCNECGTELEDGMTECPNCGCPMNDTQDVNENPQKVEVTGVKLTKKVKVIIGTVIAILIAGGITAFGVTQYQKHREAEEYSQRVEDYYDDLESVTYTMLDGAAEAEESGNLIKQVWYNAIYKKEDEATDKYTKIKNSFVSDFNDALSNLFADSRFNKKISDIEDNQKTVNKLMKKLKNPPDEYKDAYEAVSKLYDAYISLTNCVTDPSGSLQTYSGTFNDADTNTANAYNAMKLYLDD